VRLAKLILSNPKLRGGTIEYTYEKPFDVLLEIMGTPAEWRRGEVGPEIVLQFSVEARVLFPILLGPPGGIPAAEVLIRGFLIERIYRKKRGEQKL
jgi:hypothetical protein